jgi:hypothetical protein
MSLHENDTEKITQVNDPEFGFFSENDPEAASCTRRNEE